MGSEESVTAFRTELSTGFCLCAAPGALVLWPESITAFRTELCPLGPGAAFWTEGRCLAGEINVPGQVLFSHLFTNLLSCCLGLRSGQFGFHIWSTIIAKSALAVPACVDTYPIGTLRALAEIRFGLLNGTLQGFVMGRPSDGTFYLGAASARLPEYAAKDVPRSAEGARGETSYRGLEFTHETVTAPVAKKLELETLVGRVVTVVTGKLN
jgi:hypothetical protein